VNLGRGERTIINQGKEAGSPFVTFHPGAWRSINFPDGRVLEEYIDRDERVYRGPVTTYVVEQPLDQLPWSDEPWKIGALILQPEMIRDRGYAALSLYVSPVAFEQFWEMADAPENERSVVTVEGQVNPYGNVDIYEIRLKPRSRSTTHPVVLERQGVIPWWGGVISAIGWLLAALLVIELIRWLWR
jgi:hypothetical protein